MQLKNLYLRQFRCYPEYTFDFMDGLNIITGPNGAGKTTILEAIHLLSLTRSFRTHNDRHLIARGKTNYLVRGKLEDPKKNLIVQNAFSSDGNRQITIDGATLKAKKELLGRFPVVIMVPEDLELAQGPDGLRRAFIDRVLAVSSPKYLNDLLKFRRILKQRNAALRQAGATQPSQISVWDSPLADCAHSIWQKRTLFFQEFSPIFRQAWSQQRPDIPAAIEYQPVEYDDGSAIQAALEASRDLDFQTRRTNVGPQRDKIKFFINGSLLRYFGSQGEQKLFIVTLKLAEARYLENKLGTAPVLLLDDLLATLDNERSQNVIRELSANYQTIVSTTEAGTKLNAGANNGTNQIRLPAEGEACPA